MIWGLNIMLKMPFVYKETINKTSALDYFFSFLPTVDLKSWSESWRFS